MLTAVVEGRTVHEPQRGRATEDHTADRQAGTVPAHELSEEDRRRRLDSDERRAALERSQLLDAPPTEALDRATRLASTLLSAPVSLLSIIESDRQFFASQVGLAAPWDELRETPLSHSFCQLVVLDDEPLDVEDSRQDPRVEDNLAIDDLGVAAYLGVPIRSPEGVALGSFCVIDDQPRTWTADEGDRLRDIADMVESELGLRESLRAARRSTANFRNLLDVVAHDLKNPLTVVLGTLKTLASQISGGDPQLDRLTTVANLQAARMNRLITQLQARAGQPDRSDEPIDVSALLHQVHAAHEATGTGHRISVDTPSTVIMRTDRDRLERILGNLVDNALNHAGEQAHVTLRLEDTGERRVITVSDDGRGIPNDELDALFQPFVRGTTTTSGSGLGLHIVSIMARELNAELDVQSEVGAGTTFRLWFDRED